MYAVNETYPNETELAEAYELIESLAIAYNSLCDLYASQWISIEDRLPEREDYVFVCVDLGAEGILRITAIHTTAGWYFLSDSKYIKIPWKVTHWIKLPEPPKTTQP